MTQTLKDSLSGVEILFDHIINIKKLSSDFSDGKKYGLWMTEAFAQGGYTMTQAIQQLAVSSNGTEIYLTTHTSGNTIIIRPPNRVSQTILLPISLLWANPDHYLKMIMAYVEDNIEGFAA